MTESEFQTFLTEQGYRPFPDPLHPGESLWQARIDEAHPAVPVCRTNDKLHLTLSYLMHEGQVVHTTLSLTGEYADLEWCNFALYGNTGTQLAARYSHYVDRLLAAWSAIAS